MVHLEVVQILSLRCYTTKREKISTAIPLLIAIIGSLIVHLEMVRVLSLRCYTTKRKNIHCYWCCNYWLAYSSFGSGSDRGKKEKNIHCYTIAYCNYWLVYGSFGSDSGIVAKVLYHKRGKNIHCYTIAYYNYWLHLVVMVNLEVVQVLLLRCCQVLSMRI
ncbi:hypothetical protein CEXT_631471 [Caerostris extrusa]|uniref:Uncharacterized protein n=1 Tax=Caerostris extrusa TaxID=172846 RepID=A0AAV4RMC9_CAEEX|nr:hypothetical protein CEXT_631471 [Caerostris extrusa]